MRLTLAEAPADVWRRITDLERHARVIPLTSVDSSEPMRPGLAFVATTRLGPLAMRDRMRVEQADAPEADVAGRLVVTKHGPFAGRVDATVAPSDGGALLTWRQDLEPTWLPKLLHPLAARIAAVAYRVALRQLATGKGGSDG